MRKQGRIPLAEAARLAVVAESTVRGWVREKKVDAVKYGPGWWVSEKSLLAVIKPAVRP